MKISQLLKDELIEPNLILSEKNAVLEYLVKLASSSIKEKSTIEPDVVLQALKDREAMMSTGIGNGVAIPHAKVEGLNSLILIFAKSNNGIDFQALDEAPVHIIFLVIAPRADDIASGDVHPSSANDYLKLLAAISLLLKKKKNRTALLEANTKAEIMAAIKTVEQL
jgi:mannitol/fructose-specific phosphotransferase system IIA component (Ntr-type)